MRFLKRYFHVITKIYLFSKSVAIALKCDLNHCIWVKQQINLNCILTFITGLFMHIDVLYIIMHVEIFFTLSLYNWQIRAL